MANRAKHDWEIIAERDPWFGVLAEETYRKHRMDPEARARFFAIGQGDISTVVGWFDAEFGARPEVRALDIGCGLGRLSVAIAKHVREVVGYDVSETMVRLAAENAPPNMRTTTILPDGPFDWINSYIVFQHIPPAEGLALLDVCLARAAPNAFLSLQFTGWRATPAPPDTLLSRFRRWRNLRVHRTRGWPVDALITMHDYNFSDILQRVTAAGFSRIVLRPTAHGEYHGAWVLAHRS